MEDKIDQPDMSDNIEDERKDESEVQYQEPEQTQQKQDELVFELSPPLISSQKHLFQPTSTSGEGEPSPMSEVQH
jgi:hypothetical protein